MKTTFIDLLIVIMYWLAITAVFICVDLFRISNMEMMTTERICFISLMSVLLILMLSRKAREIFVDKIICNKVGDYWINKAADLFCKYLSWPINILCFCCYLFALYMGAGSFKPTGNFWFVIFVASFFCWLGTLAALLNKYTSKLRK